MQKKKSFFRIETIIVLLIAGCMIFLNAFTTGKMNELESAGTDAMFIRQDLPYQDSEVLAEEIIQYRPDTCKMIEMYDENFEMVFSIQFDEEVSTVNDIQEYPELISLLKESTEGQTSITINDIEENVYFQWTPNSRGESRLVLVYSTKPKVHNIWVFTFVCYLVLVLVFVLLLILHHREYDDKIKRYKQVAKETSDEIKN